MGKIDDLIEQEVDNFQRDLMLYCLARTVLIKEKLDKEIEKEKLKRTQ